MPTPSACRRCSRACSEYRAAVRRLLEAGAAARAAGRPKAAASTATRMIAIRDSRRAARAASDRRSAPATGWYDRPGAHRRRSPTRPATISGSTSMPTRDGARRRSAATIAHGFLTLSLSARCCATRSRRRPAHGDQLRPQPRALRVAGAGRRRASARASRSARSTTSRAACRRRGTSPSSARAARSRASSPMAGAVLHASSHIDGAKGTNGHEGEPGVTDDTRAVRDDEQLDWPRLEAWLRERLPACRVAGPRPRAADAGRAVSRRPLEPHLSRPLRRRPSSCCGGRRSDRSRRPRTTWRASSAGCRPSIRVYPLAPRVYLLCDDPVGRRLGLLCHGAAARHRRAARGAAADQGPARRAASASAARSSMRSPTCTPSTSTAAGLTHLGKPAGFVERQVRGWSERWQRSKTSDAAGDGRARDVAGRAPAAESRRGPRSCTATSSSTT